MYKKIDPKKQRHFAPRDVKEYVRVTSRMLYLSNEAMKLMGNCESVNISIDKPQRVMVISPNGAWKLSTVRDTKYARRIENGSSMTEILKGGFPYGMLGAYLPCQKDMSGSLIVSLIPEQKEGA